MRRAFQLTFNTSRGGFRLGVNIDKSFSDRISFKTGYNRQPVKWIKVTTKDPQLEHVTSRSEIAHVVRADELESLWPTGEQTEDGLPEYVVVEKNNLKNMFQSHPEMLVLKTVPLASIPFHHLEGSHYFVNISKAKKGKVRVSNPEDEALYNLIYQGLLASSEALVVSYNAMNSNKHAIIYADRSTRGLRMSNLLGSNYQRERKEKQAISGKVSLKMFDRLVGSSRSDEMADYKDDYGEKLEELAQAALRGEVVQKKDKPQPVCFSRLSALEDSDDEEEVVVKKPKKSSSKPAESDEEEEVVVKKPVKKPSKPVESDSEEEVVVAKKPAKKSSKPVEEEAKKAKKSSFKPAESDDEEEVVVVVTKAKKGRSKPSDDEQEVDVKKLKKSKSKN